MNQGLIVCLLSGCFLFHTSCDVPPKEKQGVVQDDTKKQGPGPDRKTDAQASNPANKPGKKEAQPDQAQDPSAGLSRYGSCDELQHAVYSALKYKKDNEAKRALNRPGGDDKITAVTEAGSERESAAPAATSAAAPQRAAKSSSASRGRSQSASAPKQEGKKLEQFTNIQEVGVDEPDHVKIGPDNIYLLRGQEIQVANRETLRHLGVVPLQQLTRAKKLLITSQHLFVLGELDQQICKGELITPQPIRAPQEHGRRKIKKKRKRSLAQRLWQLLAPEAHARPGFVPPREPPHLTQPDRKPQCRTRTDTVVQAYKLRQDGRVEHMHSWRFKGGYVDARMTAGRIVLIFQQQLNLVPQLRAILTNPAMSLAHIAIPKEPIQLDKNDKASLLSCSAIYRSKMFDQDYRLTKVVAINATALAEVPKQAGFVGGGDQIYMSTENLYLAKVGKRWLPYKEGPPDPSADAVRERQMRDALMITQIGFAAQTGGIAILAQTDSSLQGRPKDQWAFREMSHEGKTLLGVFTTTGKMWSEDPLDITNNQLWILGRSGTELAVVAKLPDIAPGETIRSIRYIGKWAYAVTFKKTDPLFAIDLSHPLKPRIVGQLKIPGFSTYMHPVGEGKLIGIGFDVYQDESAEGAAAVKFQGIKLSLFDISDPRDMREVHTITFGGRGSYSDVTGDHHAFFYDPKLNRLAFPLTLLQGKSKTEKWQNTRHITFAGAVLVQIGPEKLRELARWRHNIWIPKKCYQEMQQGRWWEAKTVSQDINRVYRIEDKYLTVSRYGLKTYSVRTPQVTRQRLHLPAFEDCDIGQAKN